MESFDFLDVLQRINSFKGYKGTEFHFPIFYGIHGQKYPTKPQIEHGLQQVRTKQEGLHRSMLWLTELYESLKQDNNSYFFSDNELRTLCVELNESINGWAFVLGEVDADLQYSSATEQYHSEWS